MRERHWSDDQTIVTNPDGSITLTLSTSGTRDLLRWLLSFGSGAEILSPPDLRDALRDEALKLANLYSDPCRRPDVQACQTHILIAISSLRAPVHRLHNVVAVATAIAQEGRSFPESGRLSVAQSPGVRLSCGGSMRRSRSPSLPSFSIHLAGPTPPAFDVRGAYYASRIVQTIFERGPYETHFIDHSSGSVRCPRLLPVRPGQQGQLHQ